MIRKFVFLVGIIVIVGGIYAWRKGAIHKNADGTISINTAKVKSELKKDMENAEVSPYTKGRTLFGLFKYEEALAQFKKGLKEDPESKSASLARYRIAECYKKLKQPKKAIKAYQTYLKKYPDGDLAAQAKKQVEILKATTP